jgi:hypothetical protein
MLFQMCLYKMDMWMYEFFKVFFLHFESLLLTWCIYVIGFFLSVERKIQMDNRIICLQNFDNTGHNTTKTIQTNL